MTELSNSLSKLTIFPDSIKSGKKVIPYLPTTFFASESLNKCEKETEILVTENEYFEFDKIIFLFSKVLLIEYGDDEMNSQKFSKYLQNLSFLADSMIECNKFEKIPELYLCFFKFQELAEMVKNFFVKYTRALNLEVRVDILWKLLNLTEQQREYTEIFDSKIKILWMTLFDMQEDYFIKILSKHNASFILPNTCLC